jgi:hypothetical protein
MPHLLSALGQQNCIPVQKRCVRDGRTRESPALRLLGRPDT